MQYTNRNNTEFQQNEQNEYAFVDLHDLRPWTGSPGELSRLLLKEKLHPYKDKMRVKDLSQKHCDAINGWKRLYELFHDPLLSPWQPPIIDSLTLNELIERGSRLDPLTLGDTERKNKLAYLHGILALGDHLQPDQYSNIMKLTSKLDNGLYEAQRAEEEYLSSKLVDPGDGNFKSTIIDTELHGSFHDDDINEAAIMSPMNTDLNKGFIAKCFSFRSFKKTSNPSANEKSYNRLANSYSSPTMISQGILGDCSLLATIAAIVNDENRAGKHSLIKRVFPQDDNGIPLLNPNGIYAIKVTINGEDRIIFVDDIVPVCEKGNHLFACTNDPGSAWVTIINKAFIKMNNGSFRIIGSSPLSELFHYTGRPSETIHLNRISKDLRDGTWNSLYSAYRNQQIIICAGTSELDNATVIVGRSDSVQINTGLVQYHAYAVTGMREVRGARLLRLRNPWGTQVWTGDFGPTDSIWERDPAFAEIRIDQSTDTGSFWIVWQDLLEHFSHLYLSWNLTDKYCCNTLIGPEGIDQNSIQCLLRPIQSLSLPCHDPQFRIDMPDLGINDETIIWVFINAHKVYPAVDSLDQDCYTALHVLNRPTSAFFIEPAKRGLYTNTECIVRRIKITRSSYSKALAYDARRNILTDFQTSITDLILAVGTYCGTLNSGFNITIYTEKKASLILLNPPVSYDDWEIATIKARSPPIELKAAHIRVKANMEPRFHPFIIYKTRELKIYVETPRKRSIRLAIFKGPIALESTSYSTVVSDTEIHYSGLAALEVTLDPGIYNLIVYFLNEEENEPYRVSIFQKNAVTTSCLQLSPIHGRYHAHTECIDLLPVFGSADMVSRFIQVLSYTDSNEYWKMKIPKLLWQERVAVRVSVQFRESTLLIAPVVKVIAEYSAHHIQSVSWQSLINDLDGETSLLLASRGLDLKSRDETRFCEVSSSDDPLLLEYYKESGRVLTTPFMLSELFQYGIVMTNLPKSEETHQLKITVYAPVSACPEFEIVHKQLHLNAASVDSVCVPPKDFSYDTSKAA